MPRPKKKVAAKFNPDDFIIEVSDKNILRRVKTGYWSLDKAVGGGFPVRTATEIFGFTHVGKSTVSYEILGRLLKNLDKPSTIGLLDTEGFDPAYIKNIFTRIGCKGRMYVPPDSNSKGEPISAIEQLDELVEKFHSTDLNALLIDSLGAIQTPATLEGSIGEAKMGNRAKPINELMRQLVFWQKYKPDDNFVFMTNHSHPLLNGQGVVTTGGLGPSFLCQIRIRLAAEKRNEDGTIVIEGTIEKLRYRTSETGHRGKFQLFSMPGYGIHFGLSAVNDAIEAGVADKSDRGVISLGKKSFGFMSKLVERANDDDLFAPFIEALSHD